MLMVMPGPGGVDELESEISLLVACRALIYRLLDGAAICRACCGCSRGALLGAMATAAYRKRGRLIDTHSCKSKLVIVRRH